MSSNAVSITWREMKREIYNLRNAPPQNIVVARHKDSREVAAVNLSSCEARTSAALFPFYHYVVWRKNDRYRRGK